MANRLFKTGYYIVLYSSNTYLQQNSEALKLFDWVLEINYATILTAKFES